MSFVSWAESEGKKQRGRVRTSNPRVFKTSDAGRAASRKCYYNHREERIKYNKEWKRRNPERAKRATRNSYLKATYGITIEEFDNMFIAQNNGCAICGAKETTKGWKVDHCHDTGKVRGILCTTCNLGLGYFKDNTAALKAAIDYLGR